VIQRYIYQVLTDGIQQVTKDTSLIEQIFDELYALSEEEVAAVVTYWKAKPPTVRHGYAPRNVDVPIFSIVLENERESQTFLANDVGTVEDPERSDYKADVYGSIWTHQYAVLVYTEHPDVTAYYYELAKSILIAGNNYFVDQGLFDIDISGGDLAPDPRYIPEHLFVRRITFGCERVFTRTDRGSRLTKVGRVEGIHIDRTGSPRDAGAVLTNVTILEE